jgi:hypothetical protein
MMATFADTSVRDSPTPCSTVDSDSDETILGDVEMFHPMDEHDRGFMDCSSLVGDNRAQDPQASCLWITGEWTSASALCCDDFLSDEESCMTPPGSGLMEGTAKVQSSSTKGDDGVMQQMKCGPQAPTSQPPGNPPPPKRGVKRPAPSEYSVPLVDDDDDDKRFRSLMQLLSEPSFNPGQRPDRILGEAVVAGTMFKEHPKRRREHSSAKRRMDKWYNTGGIKSASDRFTDDGVGLRKRYGKIVREGLPVLRFHEYKLLKRNSADQRVSETKDGPTLFRLVPEAKRRREMGSMLSVVKTQQAELQRLRRSNQTLTKQLRQTEKQLSKQTTQLQQLQEEVAKRRQSQQQQQKPEQKQSDANIAE